MINLFELIDPKFFHVNPRDNLHDSFDRKEKKNNLNHATRQSRTSEGEIEEISMAIFDMQTQMKCASKWLNFHHQSSMGASKERRGRKRKTGKAINFSFAR